MDSVTVVKAKHFYDLTAKETRLFEYLLEESNSRNIGDICKVLHTTPLTLLGTTLPSLRKKTGITEI